MRWPMSVPNPPIRPPIVTFARARATTKTVRCAQEVFPSATSWSAVPPPARVETTARPFTGSAVPHVGAPAVTVSAVIPEEPPRAFQRVTTPCASFSTSSSREASNQ